MGVRGVWVWDITYYTTQSLAKTLVKKFRCWALTLLIPFDNNRGRSHATCQKTVEGGSLKLFFTFLQEGYR